jgi:hypothetical protein
MMCASEAVTLTVQEFINMKIGQPFKKLNSKEYFFFIDNYKKYTDFNTLGLYRSLLENDKLILEEKIAIRDYANKSFGKTFEFLQLKDPYTFVELFSLGSNLTEADERQIWDDVKRNQERFLKEKRIKHRNFGAYSKHNCSYENCPYNGLMIRQGSLLQESFMHFHSDKSQFSGKTKSEKLKKERKSVQQTIKKLMQDE